MKRTCCVFMLAFAGLCWADIALVKQEPNLEKRSELALDFANESIDAAKKVYDSNPVDFAARLADVREATELSYTSLSETGKRARRSPKYFKRAELKMRALMRRLDNLAKEVSVDDKKLVEDVYAHVSELNERVLHEIMSKK